MFDLALIFPCYNEGRRIKPTFEAYFNHFSSATWASKKVALVFVNDGSKDNTLEILHSFKQQYKSNIEVLVLSYESNRGKGGAIKEGVLSVDAVNYGFTDADLAYEPSLVDVAYTKLKTTDMVIGERVSNSNVSLYSSLRNFISTQLRRFVHTILSLPNYDTQCGFKFFSNSVAKKVVSKIKHERFSFDIELILRAEQLGLEIKKFPIEFNNSNESSVTWRDGIRYVLDAIALSENFKNTNKKYLLTTLFVLSAGISTMLYGWVAIKGYLFSDDFTWLWHGQKIESLYDVLIFKMSTFYSPVMNMFYAASYRLIGYDPIPLFIIGIFVHILVASLSGVLVWQLSRSRLIALTVTALTAVAGVAYEPLVWIGANMHSFVTMFVLSALTTYCLFLKRQKLIYLIFSFLSLVLALGTKESAVVAPVLLLLTTFYFCGFNISKILNKKIIIYWISLAFVSVGYLYQQFLWQRDSIWLESGVWQIGYEKMLRLPYILLDNIIPISIFKFWFNDFLIILLGVVTSISLAVIFYRYRQIKLIWFGLAWTLASILPFIFFQTQVWWEPLASRYNYLPRIGVIFLLAALLQNLIVNNRSRKIISGLVFVIIISVVTQFSFMVHTIKNEYAYVYNTGRSLSGTMREIAIIKPDKIYVRWDYPFTGNNAHIVGAASVIASIPEEKIIFLKKGESKNLSNNEILLYWDAQSRKYSIRNN